jgi:PAS domain S-box-containing protein
MTISEASAGADDLPVLKSRFVPAWAGRYLAPFMAALAVLALSVMLVFTIYFTQLDLEWTAFLLGVLFAAVLSLISQSVKAQWRLLRRTAQLKRSKELLAEEIARRERSAQAQKSADQRFRTVMDALPAMVFFVDREERCRYHNLAFQAWCGRSAEEVGGSPLRDLLDGAAYQDLKTSGMEALVGKETQYEAHWQGPEGGRRVAVKLLPYPVGAQTTSGFYAFVSELSATGHSARVAEPAAAETSSEAVYLDAMERELTTDDAPREYLLRAIEEDQFILLEQKIEPLLPETGPGNMREILLRLQEDEERTVLPGGFLEIAERYELSPAIDRWVIRKLLKSCASMKEADAAWRMPLYCMNVSNTTLRDRGFANHVRSQLQHWNLAGSRLCFEINHSSLAEQETDISMLMDQLKPLGCRFTVDGFGSHKVSFAPFRELRFDFLKIDGSIVSQILHKPSELAKARAIVLACQKLGVRTIAQFVEDEASRTKLKEIGVDYVQGFGIDRPGPLAVVTPAAVPA